MSHRTDRPQRAGPKAPYGRRPRLRRRPEQNPTETPWHHPRSHALSNRVYDDDDDDHPLKATTTAWQRLLRQSAAEPSPAAGFVTRLEQSLTAHGGDTWQDDVSVLAARLA
ncbi:MAG: hypothetical protein ACFCVE_14920 [Phycisphaerae bacterium]